jgi:hypothetical protein
MSDFATKAREIAETTPRFGYSGDNSELIAAITAALEEAVAAEREQCAMIADVYIDGCFSGARNTLQAESDRARKNAAETIAATIRRRTGTPT